jgi:hypothetical protein
MGAVEISLEQAREIAAGWGTDLDAHLNEAEN